jgi:hypothetical protein
VTPFAIDIGIGDTLEAINGILVRVHTERGEMWSSLAGHLEAVSLAVGDLDRMYFAVLAEIENVFAQPKPAPERIESVIAQATIYCTDGRLTLRLAEWRGIIEAAAFNHALKHRRYRALASTLRSIDDPLRKYIQRLYHLENGADGSVSNGGYPQFGDTPESVPHDRKWDLRTVLDLLKSAAAQLSQEEQPTDGVADLSEACEEAIRNYDRALSLALVQLIGHARQDLAMERL